MAKQQVYLLFLLSGIYKLRITVHMQPFAKNMTILGMAGPGAFSRSIPNEVLVKIMNNEKHRKEFLDFCYEFDRQPSVIGLGKDNLMAIASKNR